jgi:hypothetical protein
VSKRRTLILANGSRFVFTPKTVSLDVSDAFQQTGKPVKRGSFTLHVGRTKAALERAGGPIEELELDAAVDLLTTENNLRKLAGKPLVEKLFDPRLWADVHRQAKHLRAARRLKAPVGVRGSRRCLQSRNDPGESLWVDVETGEAALETLTPELDAKGRSTGYSSTVVFVSAEDAIRWLDDHGPPYYSLVVLHALQERAGSGSRRKPKPKP